MTDRVPSLRSRSFVSALGSYLGILDDEIVLKGLRVRTRIKRRMLHRLIVVANCERTFVECDCD
jgi:hypothetical protein